MSDLVKRLRQEFVYDGTIDEAADRIEALERVIDDALRAIAQEMPE